MNHATLTKKQIQTRKKNQKYYAKNHESILAKQRSRHQLQARQRPQRRQRHGLEGPCVRYLTNKNGNIQGRSVSLQRIVVKYRMACPVRMVGIESPGIDPFCRGQFLFCLASFGWLVGCWTQRPTHPNTPLQHTQTGWLSGCCWTPYPILPSNTHRQAIQAGKLPRIQPRPS